MGFSPTVTAKKTSKKAVEIVEEADERLGLKGMPTKKPVRR